MSPFAEHVAEALDRMERVCGGCVYFERGAAFGSCNVDTTRGLVGACGDDPACAEYVERLDVGRRA